ncbi:MAG: MFS transporter, partial [Candidatus Heimdallarchaeota archaeon]
TPPLDKSRRKADVLGSIFLALFLSLFVFGFSIYVNQIIQHSKIWSGICFVGSIVFFILFILWERRTSFPIVDLSMFKNRKFTVGIFSAILAFLGLCVIIYQLPFFLQEILLLTPIQTGLIILGTPAAMAISAILFGFLSDRIDTRYIATIGIFGMMISLIVGAVFITEDVKDWILFLIAIIIGLSLGAFIAPNSNSVMSSAPEKKLGVANGMLGLSTNVGFSLGTALATAIFAMNQNLFQKINGGNVNDLVNYVPAMRLLFGIFAIFMLFSTIFSYFRGPEIRNHEI